MAMLKVKGALMLLIPLVMMRTLPSPRPTNSAPLWLLDGNCQSALQLFELVMLS
jgi:hypothetical protein